MSVWRAGSVMTTAIFMALGLGHGAMAAGEQCVGKVPTIRVIGQPIPTIPFLDSQKGEFEKKWNTKVEIQQFGENDRRAKSRLDASQGTGAYQVYYIDEANVAEYAASKWVLPLLDLHAEGFRLERLSRGPAGCGDHRWNALFRPVRGRRRPDDVPQGHHGPEGVEAAEEPRRAEDGRRRAEQPADDVWHVAARPPRLGHERLALDAVLPRHGRPVVRRRQARVQLRQRRQGHAVLPRPHEGCASRFVDQHLERGRRRFPGRPGRSHHRERRVRSLGGGQDEVADRRQGRLRAAARSASRRRVSPTASPSRPRATRTIARRRVRPISWPGRPARTWRPAR